MTDLPPFAPFQPLPTPPEKPAIPNKPKRNRKKASATPAAPVAPKEPRQRRKKTESVKRAAKYDLQTILRVAAALKEADQPVFEKLLGVLSEMPKAGRERVLKALGEVLG